MHALSKYFLRNSASSVSRYYDKHTIDYMSVGGDVIQALRPTNTDELLNYLVESIGLKDGMKVLDAGCGICGPAIFFANAVNIEIDAVTNSPVQEEIARNKIGANDGSGKVKVRLGDYHELDKLYDSNKFDAVIFLESLGHAKTLEKVIKSAFKVLKPGGFIYIKDFFRLTTADKEQQKQIDRLVQTINKNYCYNTLELDETIHILQKTGFESVTKVVPKIRGDRSYTTLYEQRVQIQSVPYLTAVTWFEISGTKPIVAG